MRSSRFLVTEFRQESNAFSPIKTTIDSWRKGGWMIDGNKLYTHHKTLKSAIGGMIRFLEANSQYAEIVYGPGFYTQSGGIADDEIMELYWSKLSEQLSETKPLDMIFFSFHGALQSISYDDTEAEILRRTRAVVGEKCLLVASADLHAFISDDFAKYVDLVCGYQTYPHVDIENTGYRAARFGVRMFEQPESLSVCYTKVPMMVSAAGYDSYHEPFSSLMESGHGFVEAGDCLDFSIFQMQPWLDVQHPTSAVIVIGTDTTRVREVSEDLSRRVFGMRKNMHADVMSISDIVERALGNTSHKPVILAETADSTNAGSTGDSMAVVAELLSRAQRPRTATVVVDADAVALAHRVGVGRRETFSIGGKLNENAVAIREDGYVRSLHDGTFVPEGVSSAGSCIDLGSCAVIQFDNIDVLVCERIIGNGDPQLYKAFGLDPAMYDLVIVKANTSFRAGYNALASEIHIADVAGPAAPCIEKLKFINMKESIFPFSDEHEFQPRTSYIRHGTAS